MNKNRIRTFAKNFLQVIVIYALTTLLAYVLDSYSIHSENLLTLYLLGVLIVIMQTKSFLSTVFASVLFILTHDFLFLEPRYRWITHSRSFALSASIFLLVALIVNTLVVRLQKQIETSKYNENLHKKLYEASEGLLSVHGKDHVVKYADEALTKLTGCEVDFDFNISKNDGNEARKWCFKNSSKCGHGETEFSDAGYKYIPVRSNSKTVGVVSIDCSKNELSREAEECLIALLSQVSIAFEREELEDEKRQEARSHEREQLKAMVMKGISHDMYPRISFIHKSSKEMVEGLNLMTEEDVRKKLIVIEQESDYLTQTVDNLLDITK